MDSTGMKGNRKRPEARIPVAIQPSFLQCHQVPAIGSGLAKANSEPGLSANEDWDKDGTKQGGERERDEKVDQKHPGTQTFRQEKKCDLCVSTQVHSTLSYFSSCK